AYEHGFNVTLATDAMTDTRPEAHDHSIRSVFLRLGESGSTDDILALLERTA
ncbi:hydrolase, partial [Pseudomonas sp. FW306-2-11AD]